MTSILPFDELNAFIERLRTRYADGQLPQGNKAEEEDIIDELLDLFLLAYAQGNSVTNANLSSDWMPPVDEVMRVVDAKVADKTWRERVEDYFANGGSVDDIVRIAETETHRDANTAALIDQDATEITIQAKIYRAKAPSVFHGNNANVVKLINDI